MAKKNNRQRDNTLFLTKEQREANHKAAAKIDKANEIRRLYAETVDRDLAIQRAYNEGRAISNDFVTQTRGQQDRLHKLINENGDLIKSSFGNDAYNALKKDSQTMQDSVYREYYKDYMNTSDYINGDYQQKQEYLDDQYKNAKKEKIVGTLGSMLNAAAASTSASQIPTKTNQEISKGLYEQSKNSVNTVKEASDREKVFNQYRTDLYNEEYTNKNLELINSDKELKNLVNDAYEAKQNVDANFDPTGMLNSGGMVKLGSSNDNSRLNAAYQAIVNKGYTQEEANSLIDTYTREQNRIAAEAEAKKVKKFADKHPALASATYVGANVLQIGAVPEVLQSGIENAVNGEYKPMDVNSTGFTATRFRENVSQTVSENIQQEVQNKTNSEFWSRAASFAYQTGLSMGDFLSLSVLPEPVSLAIMGTSAGVTAVKDATDRGASADQALVYGVFAGTAEAFFERFSLEKLNALKASNKTGVYNTVMNILKQQFTEGSEEVFTDVANAISDQIINGNASELARQYQALVGKYDGDTDKAWKELAKNFGLQLAESYAGGALSGGIIGMYGGAVGNYRLSSIGKSVSANTEELNSLINVASALPADSNAAKLVKQMNTSTNVTNAKVGELYVNTLNDVKESFNKAETMSELTNEFAAVSENAGDYNGSLLTEFARSYQENARRIVETEQSAEKKAVKVNAKTNANIVDTNTAAESDGATVTAKNDNIAETITATAATKKNTFALPVTIDSTGNNAVITSVHSTKGGDVRFTTVSGETVSVNDITAKNQHMADIVNDAVLETKDNIALGANGASLYIQKALDANLNSNEYVAFKNYAKQAYLLGVGGANWGAVTKQAAGVISRLGTTTARQFYDAGVADNKALTEIRESNKQKRKKTVQKRTGGKYENKTDNTELDAFLQRAAEKTHIDIVYNGGNDNNTGGEFKAGEGRAFINEGTNTRGDLTSYFHEGVGEALLAFNSADYRLISDSIINYLEDQNVITTNNDIRAYAEGYHEKQANTTIRDAKNELTNDCIAALFTSEEGFKQYCEWLATDKNTTVNEKKTIIEKLKDLFNSLVEKFKDFVNRENFSSSEQSIAEMEIKKADELRKQILSAMDTMVENLENGTEVEIGKKNSVNIKNAITIDMSEEIRAKVLKNTRISLTDGTVSSKDIDVNDYDDIKSRIEKPLRAKLDKLGVFKKYKSNAINIDFEFTHGGFSKSIHSQKEYGGSNADFASVAANLDMLLDNAVLIETHADKGKGTPKENNQLIQTYVLVSALKSGNDITPIQFEIMEYKNNENRLYLAVAMTKINEADVVGNTGDNDVAQTNLLSTSNISIVNIFKKINPKDKNFLKYIPDEFLNAEQKKAKVSALDIEAEKYGKKDNADSNLSVNINTNTDSNPEAEFDRLVNTSMTMEDAKQMIQRAFVLGEISRFEPDYKNGDEWLKGEGVDMVALHIENEYALQQKYLNKIPAYLDGEIFVESILEAYQNGTLTGKEKAKAQRLDTSVETRVNDERFYSPQRIDNAVRLLDLADQKAVGKDKDNILAARAKIILFAHNSGAAELLGLTQTELNQKLRSWSGYNKKAADISKRLNAGVALANRWSGIENCSNLVKYVASRYELAGLVKSVEGTSSPYERNYITRTMLALDTHIDWSWLDFKFESHRDVNNGKSGNVNGYFRHRENLIVISHSSGANTVAHEMGHALDYKWGNDLGFKGQFLTEVFSNTERINDPTIRQFFDNFKIFLDDITDSSDIRNEYTIDVKEVFARFVARFVEWTDNTASNNFYRERSFYDDKFTLAQFVEFARLLQEKSMLENTADERIPNDESSFSVNIDTDKSSLIKENKQLQKSVEYYKMMSKRNTGHKVSRSEIRRIAAELKNSWNSTMKVDEISEELTALYDHISSGEATWGTIELMGKTLGKELVESSKAELDPEYEEILNDLKTYHIYIDDYQRQEIKHVYGNVRNWLNGIRRGIKYNTNGEGMPLDSLWQELSGKYPFLFDADTNSNDMPIRLYEVIEQLLDTSYNEYGYDDNELAEMIMLDIYDKYYDIPEIVTPVDRANKKLIQERIENKNRLDEVKRADKERYEKKVQKIKEYYQDMNARLRTRKNDEMLDKLAKQRAKYEGREKRLKDTRERSKLCDSIRKQLNKILTLASNPTKEKHIPNAIVESVKALAESVTLDGTQYDEKLKTKLANFREGFEEIKSNTQYSVISELYNDYIQDKIIDINNRYGNVALKELPVEALREIDDLIKMTAQSINNINRLFKKERNATIESYAEKAVAELNTLRKTKLYDGRINSLFYNTMKPEYFFEYLGSNTMSELYHDLRNGEDVWAVDVTEARDFATDVRKKYNYLDWDFNATHEFDSIDGTVTFTLQEMLGIYANSLGEHTRKNLLGGGIVYQAEDKKGIKRLLPKRNDNGNHRLSLDNVIAIVSSLSGEQKAYVRDMMKYLSSEMGAKGNEVARELYGVELFKEEMYYPAIINKDSRHQSSKEVRADKKIKNAGFTNAIVPEAKQPVVLKNFDDVWATHVDEMSKYHAFALPMENIDRVYNLYNVSDNKYSSTKEAIKNAHGTKAISYIDDLIEDINGGVVQEAGTDIVSWGMSKFKKNAVFASMSVVVQQPSAIGRALSEIDAKYFAATTGSGFNRKAYDEMKKYAPIAAIKEMGYFDTNMAQSTVDFLNNNEYEGLKKKAKAFVVDGAYRDKAMSFLAAKADEITWTHIWNACKKEAKANNPKSSNDDVCKIAAKKFTNVIVKTQVYDSVFSRSGLMRSNDNLVKNAMAFMAEPTTAVNMLGNAIIQSKRGNMSKSKAARVLGSLVVASLLNSLLQSVVTAARADDDDKDWKEVYLAQLIPNFIDNLNPVNQIGFLKDVISIFRGYDVSRSDMNMFVDLYIAFQNMHNDNVSTSKKITGLVGAMGAFFGIPAKNILRDVDAAKNVCKDFLDEKTYSRDNTNELFKEEMNSALGFDLFVTAKDKRFKKLYDALVKGDKDKYDKVYKELQNTGLDDDSIMSGIKTAYAENDTRVAMGAIAYVSGDMDGYIDYINQIADEYDEEFAKKVIDSYANWLKNAKYALDDKDEEGYADYLEKALSSGVEQNIVENAIKGIDSKSNDSDEAKMLYKWTDIYAALDSGQFSAYEQMYQDALEVKIANGKTEDEAKEQIKKKIQGYYKQDYIDNESMRSAIESKLNSTGLFSQDDYNDWVAQSFNGTENMKKAFEGGLDSTRKYVSDRVQAKVKGGMTEDSAKYGIRTSISNAYKQEFINGDANTRAKIITYMTNTGIYGSRQDVISYINKNWLK